MATDIPKRVRYEVLRRDGYTCRYCGAKAPDVEITVDHVVPKVLGGTDDPSNLVAACRDCNGGKTSSSPDAPLVAEVSETALQWASAMKAAQARALADLEAREADRCQFAEWWDAWTYESGGKRHTFERPGDWGLTVDQLISAGLPLRLLKDCIDGAMGRRKVTDKFRYMCGTAWHMVTDLQESARTVVPGGVTGEPAVATTDRYEQGRLDLAQELLAEASEEERAHFLDCADYSAWLDEDDDPLTEAQQACEAVESLLNSARCNVDWLVTRVKQTLEGLPGGLGERCLAEARDVSTIADPLSRMAMEVSSALYALEDLIDLPADVAYMKDLPKEEAAEWLEFAKALYLEAKFGDERWIARAADCARVVNDGSLYNVMCSARGTRIPACPARSTHCAKIAELECCKHDESGEHRGHRVCEKHLEQLIDGTFVSRSGETFSAVDFTEAKEAVPFLWRAPRPGSSTPSGKTPTSSACPRWRSVSTCSCCPRMT